MAVAEINAAGGVNGRKIELLKEDSVNPQTASTKAERMIERDKVACIIGEISSASALTIGQVAERTQDALHQHRLPTPTSCAARAASKYMFHIESQNSMYVKTCGRSLMAQGLVKGKKWFSLTADYAFGHDLLRVAKRFMAANGGEFAADKLVPTDATDFSPLLLEIRNAKPDLVISNLAGNQITNFLKQYSEFGLAFPVAGFGFDTAVAWAAGKGNFLGHLAAGVAPPDRHARHARNSSPNSPSATTARRRTRPGATTTRSSSPRRRWPRPSRPTPTKLVEHFEKGAKFGLMKTREGYFRKADHQMMHEMYTVQALPAAQIKNEYDIFRSSAAGAGRRTNRSR